MVAFLSHLESLYVTREEGWEFFRQGILLGQGGSDQSVGGTIGFVLYRQGIALFGAQEMQKGSSVDMKLHKNGLYRVLFIALCLSLPFTDNHVETTQRMAVMAVCVITQYNYDLFGRLV